MPRSWRRGSGWRRVYVLKTSLSTRNPPWAQALATDKEQSQVEWRIHRLHGPLAVAPMFLKNPERIAGLLCILVRELTVLVLIERQVRRGSKGKPLLGLYPTAARAVPRKPAQPRPERACPAGMLSQAVWGNRQASA
jgi:hypothetical protein